MQPVIVIVGGGIAGLCAAIAFARRGCRVEIFESSSSLDEVGAGLQLSPNVTRLMQSLGLADRMYTVMAEPPSLALLSASDLKTLSEIPAGDFARRRWRAPYGVIHRADLQAVLADAVSEDPLCRLHLDRTVNSGSEAEIGSQLMQETGAEPDLIIAADGVWSTIRDGAPGTTPATFSGRVAWRGLADPQDCEAILSPERVNAFLGPDTHLVTYPLGHRGVINAVAVTPGASTNQGWDNTGDVSELRSRLTGWNRKIVSMLDRISWQSWPLFEVRNTCFLAGSKTVLIGDAAHAMTPHAAQGAAMAIEDACALAACFEASGNVAEIALPKFSALRTPRIARVRKRGDFNRFVYHARGPIRIGRDAVLSIRPPEKLAADLDWLYSYDATDLSQV